MARRRTHRLSALFIKTAPPGAHCDGDGLYLRVDRSGARRWVQQLTIRGRPRSLGLGSVRLVSLAEARAVALAHRTLARAGGDPLAEKRRASGMPTVEDAAARVLDQRRTGWGGKYAREWAARLRVHAFPRLGPLPVSDVTTADVLAVLTPLWYDKPETARCVRQQLGAIMMWAMAVGHRPDNPVAPVGQVLGPQRDVVRHRPALPHGEVAEAIQRVQASKASTSVKLGFEFLVLTAARSGEVRLATWDEVDLDAATWTVPASRMKAKRDHRVPLCERALAILHEARQQVSESGTLIFPSQRGKPLSDMTLSKLVKELGIAAVPHGFRSSFRDWASERTSHPREVIEAALAHTVRSQTEAAYARSDLFERRRRLMNDWAAYLSGQRGQVIPLRR